MDKTYKNQLRRARTHQANVIAMRLDAAFFFERGVRFLERNDLRRALKAFRKTVEYEPENPVNHCNLAGVLSEMGDFEASNEVLHHVLQDLDPSMAECQFYLANNYANMGDYESAEVHVLRYLDADPDGEYVEDAEEMLNILMDEFGGGRAYQQWEEERRQEEQQHATRDGRHLLEQGQFEAAVEWLERMIAQDRENTAARNNLSLAYYYTGRYEDAIQTAESVLEEIPDNIHALCNLTVFSAHLGPRERFMQCVSMLSKVFPLHYDHAMKVGTTLGLVGNHHAAYMVFRRLVRMTDQPEPILLHSVAASAANAGEFAVAKKWWKALGMHRNMSDVAQYYTETVERAQRSGAKKVRISYQYDLPAQMNKQGYSRLGPADPGTWRHDPLLRASLYWGLRHGGEDTRKTVIRTLARIADADAEKALRAFLQRPDGSPNLQAAALYALQRMGARGRVEIWQNGSLVSQRMGEVPRDVILSVHPQWQDIFNQAAAWLRQEHKARYIGEAKRAWVGYLKHSFLKGEPTFPKPEIWVAALLYAVMKRHNEPVRQREVAEWFHVSVSSVSKAGNKLLPYFVKMP